MYDRASGSLNWARTVVSMAWMLLAVAQAEAAANQFGPASVDAGPVAVTPTLGTEFKHRDNIYLQERDETDSWIYVLRPGVNARLQDRENVYQLDYIGEVGWYDESSGDDDNDYFDHTVLGDASVEVSERWKITGFTGWSDLHEDRGTGLSEGFIGTFIPEPIEYEQLDFGGTVQYGADDGVARILLSAGQMDRQYQNFRDLTRSRDREETSLGLTLFYPLAPNTDALVEYAIKDIEYPNPFEQAPRLDSEENALWLGAQWEMTPHLGSTAKLGYIDKDFDDDRRQDWDDIGWSVELSIQPREQDLLSIKTSRRPEETTLQGDFIVRELLEGGWTHDWTDRIFTRVTASVGRDNYQEAVTDREDDIYGASLELGYEFRRWAQVYLGYDYADKDSSVDGLSYTDNVLRMGVNFSL